MKLSEDQAALLRDPSPEDTFGILASDPGGERARVVFVIFGADNLHHYYGREFEAVRRGGKGEAWVARLDDVRAAFQQILLWSDIAMFRDEKGGEHSGRAVMQYASASLAPSATVRRAPIEMVSSNRFGARLQSGELVVPRLFSDALSLGTADILDDEEVWCGWAVTPST